MRQQVILDTGPLVALMRKRDRFHQWAVQEWGQTQPPLLTCEAVLSETLFLLRDYQIAQEGIMEMLAQNIIIVAFNIAVILSSPTEKTKYIAPPSLTPHQCQTRYLEPLPTFHWAASPVQTQNRLTVPPLLTQGER